MDFHTLLSLISTLAIVAGGVFGVVQLRHFGKQRTRESALQMLHSFQTQEFLRVVNIVFDLPEGLSKREIEDRLGDNMICVLSLFGTFESLGILVFRGEMDIQLVEDFFSGIIILSGKKFKNYLTEVRGSSRRPTYYEWFQWLFEQVEKRESNTPPIPSYIAFRDWSN